jgi:RHS repeat-associated protein
MIQGVQTATIQIGYVYGGVYYGIDQANGSFGDVGTAPISADLGRIEFTIWQNETAPVGNFTAPSQDSLGAWTLNVHNSYDPFKRVIYFGDGTEQTGEAVPAVVETLVQSEPTNRFWRIATDGQGNVYAVSTGGHPIEEFAPDGTLIRTIDPRPGDIYLGMAVDRYGNVFVVESVGSVARIAPDGTVTIVAGNGMQGYSGDGGPATSAELSFPVDLAVDDQGNLFIDDRDNNRIRKVSPDGIITTVAGNGVAGFSGDGGPAAAAEINDPEGIALDSQGDLYIADVTNERIRRVSPDGIITTIAGNGDTFHPAPDGQVAATASIVVEGGVRVDPQGNVMFRSFGAIRCVTTAGILQTIVGRTDGTVDIPDGAPAQSHILDEGGTVGSFAFDAQGRLLFLDHSSFSFSPRSLIRYVSAPLPGFSAANVLLPSSDGSEVYLFDSTGRHLKTVDAMTGSTLYSFGYDSAGRLVSITDGDNNVTTIERNANGDATAIVAPFGQRTTLAVDGHGYLTGITDPAGDLNAYTYTPDGLMQTFTDPLRNVHHFFYDPLGRLHMDQDPAGGSTTLDRADTPDGFEITMTKAMTASSSVISTYLVEQLPNGDEHRVIMTAGCCNSDEVIRGDGSQTITYGDGTVENVVLGPDPRWGIQSPITASDTITTPGGVTSVTQEQRSIILTDPGNPLSLQTWSDTVTVNGNSYTETFDSATRTFTDTSPEGRHETTTVDGQGRTVRDQVGNLQPIHLSYDSHGFLTSIGQGSGATDRTFTLTPDAQGDLATVLTPSALMTSFGYDAAGRLSSVTLPGGQQATQTYYADGNAQAVTPPGQAADVFTYTSNGLLRTYTPPDVGNGPTTITYDYYLDGQLRQVTQPDGRQLTLTYDNAGRIQAITLPGGQVSYAYDPQTGNLQTVTAPDGGILAYSYDGLLPTAWTWTGAVQGQVTQAYNNNFDVVTQTVSGGTVVDYQYDRDGLLTQAGSLTLSPDAATGLLNATTLGGVGTANHYDSFGALSGLDASFNAAGLYSTQYTRDAEGRIQQVIETIAGVTNTFRYDYDANGQLRQVSENGTVIATYVYDQNGNRTFITTPSGTMTADYNAQDEITRFGSTMYAYTSDGSLATKTSAGQTTQYSYDLLANLRHVTLPDGTRTDYITDGAGHRIGRTVNGTLVQGFLYDGSGRPVAELDGNNHLISQFVYLSDDSTPSFMIRGGATYRIVTDQNGSPRLIINAQDGSIVQRLDFDPWGNVISDTNPGFQPFGFAGGLYDTATKLVHFGSRDYDPQTGRWTGRDPQGFGGEDTNLYRYVANDPINYVDPSGLARQPNQPTPQRGPQPMPKRQPQKPAPKKPQPPRKKPPKGGPRRTPCPPLTPTRTSTPAQPQSLKPVSEYSPDELDSHMANPGAPDPFNELPAFEFLPENEEI